MRGGAVVAGGGSASAWMVPKCALTASPDAALAGKLPVAWPHGGDQKTYWGLCHSGALTRIFTWDFSLTSASKPSATMSSSAIRFVTS